MVELAKWKYYDDDDDDVTWRWIIIEFKPQLSELLLSLRFVTNFVYPSQCICGHSYSQKMWITIRILQNEDISVILDLE